MGCNATRAQIYHEDTKGTKAHEEDAKKIELTLETSPSGEIHNNTRPS